jgi:hypothetical protein
MTVYRTTVKSIPTRRIVPREPPYLRAEGVMVPSGLPPYLVIYLKWRHVCDNQSCPQPPELVTRDWAYSCTNLGLTFPGVHVGVTLNFASVFTRMSVLPLSIEARNRGNGVLVKVYHQSTLLVCAPFQTKCPYVYKNSRW